MGRRRRGEKRARVIEMGVCSSKGPLLRKVTSSPRKEVVGSLPSIVKKKKTVRFVPEVESGKGELREKYQLDESVLLGRGHYARVMLARRKADGLKVAVKFIEKRKTRTERLALEISVLKQVKHHPNIIKLYDVFETPDELQLVLELVKGGELFEHLVNDGNYSEFTAAKYIKGIASAMEYLHSLGIVHRDLKPENLLLTSWDDNKATIKVADFGLAKFLENGTLNTVCGTWAYAAPETRMEDTDYNERCDCWSIGVIMFILLSAYHPFDPQGDATDEILWDRIDSCAYDFSDEIWQYISREAKDLITKLIVSDPEKRLSATEILQHPWILQCTEDEERDKEPMLLSPAYTPKFNNKIAEFKHTKQAKTPKNPLLVLSEHLPKLNDGFILNHPNIVDDNDDRIRAHSDSLVNSSDRERSDSLVLSKSSHERLEIAVNLS